MTHTVLFVDDDPTARESIQQALQKQDFYIETAASGQEALPKVKRYDPSIIVTDLCLPGMDGIVFIHEAQKISPHAIYMVLSAYADVDKIMQAINDGHVWRYIAKPWQKEDLRLAIKNAIEMFEFRQHRRDLLEKLEKQNHQLEELNLILEEKVRERTAQLHEKNAILQMLAEGAEIGPVMEKICQAVARQIQVSPVFVHAPFLARSFSDTGEEPAEKLLQTGHQAMLENREIIGVDVMAIPLMGVHAMLGSLLIPNPQKASGFKLVDTEGSYISAAALCLIQAHSMHEDPGLSEKIDRFVGEL
jgi:response regulator RpfG family c-di-GMP phosphodiesterase